MTTSYIKTYLILLLFTFISKEAISQSIPDLNFYQYKPIHADQSSLHETMKYVYEAKRMELEKTREADRIRMLEKMVQTKEIYSSLNNFPEAITDGWHSIIATNNTDFCDERKVYVRNNKITKYIIENWLEREVLFSGVISKGKALIKTKIDETENSYLEIYFLDFSLNPDYKSSPPVQPGKVTFWTNLKQSGPIRIYVEGFEIGIISHYYKNVPNCEQEGTITFAYKPGLYNYEAVGMNKFGKEVKWNGSVKLYENACIVQGLLKR